MANNLHGLVLLQEKGKGKGKGKGEDEEVLKKKIGDNEIQRMFFDGLSLKRNHVIDRKLLKFEKSREPVPSESTSMQKCLLPENKSKKYFKTLL